MKNIICISLIIISLYSCSQPTRDKVDYCSKDNIEKTSLVDTAYFQEYDLIPKDTIVEIFEFGGNTRTIPLGKYKTDSSSIDVILKHSEIPVADGLRGKTNLILIINKTDTLIYEPDSNSLLPIDIYSNYFVFRNNKKQYIFTKLQVIQDEIICFGLNWNECYVN